MLSAMAVFLGCARTECTNAAGKDRQERGKGGNSRSGEKETGSWPAPRGFAAIELISATPPFHPTHREDR